MVTVLGGGGGGADVGVHGVRVNVCVRGALSRNGDHNDQNPSKYAKYYQARGK